MNDAHIRKHVLDELAFEPSLAAAHIGVAVTDGIVTLSGHVATLAEKVAAEAAAERVHGVRAVAGEIAVIPAGTRRHDDEEIARQALQVLAWDTAIPSGNVMVKVENGWVTLSGDVDSYFQRRAAENAVQKLNAVTGITNEINMRPDAGAVDVERRVAAVLKRSRELTGHDISAEVFGGRVTLYGAVNCVQARNVAERAAWGVPGVVFVENHLTVEPKVVAIA